jgi:hypothetical protein
MAIEQGIAQKVMTRAELYKTAEAIIKKAREQTRLLMEEGFIAEPEKEF